MALFGLYLVACGLLVVAGIAKTARPEDTARASYDLTGLPGLVMAVRLGAAGEAALGLAGLVHPTRAIAILVAVSYALFSAFVVFARAKGGVLATCGCFGSPDTPPTLTHAAVDLVLVASACSVAWTDPSGWLPSILNDQYAKGVPLLAACVLCGWLTYLVLSPLARLQAARLPQVALTRGQP
jgi:hypothetical protein